MTINDLIPDPRPIMDQIARESDRSGLLFGYAHGSMLHRPQGSLAAGYREVRVFDAITEQVVQIDYEPKTRPPDIDIIAVVKNKENFASYFKDLATSHSLGTDINYFFTLNVSESAEFESEIHSSDPRAYKRILACRPTQGFGNMSAYDQAKQVATDHIGPLDRAFQIELLARKEMMNDAVENGHLPFSLTAEDFITRFPLFYVNLHTFYGDFEVNRDKYVLPRSMEVKGKRYSNSDVIEPIR